MRTASKSTHSPPPFASDMTSNPPTSDAQRLPSGAEPLVDAHHSPVSRSTASKPPSDPYYVDKATLAELRSLADALSAFAPDIFPPKSLRLRLATRLLHEQGVELSKLDSPACSGSIWNGVLRDVYGAWKVNPRGLTKMDLQFIKAFGRKRRQDWAAECS
jgi:hypothetical protein